MAERTQYATFPVYDLKLAKELNGSTNMIVFRYADTNCVLVVKTNGIFQRYDATTFNKGTVNVSINEFFQNDDTNNNPTNIDDIITAQIKNLNKMHESANYYSANKYVIYYSVLYYFIMFTINAIMFTASMVFCKIAIREMSKSGGVLSIASLFFTNAVIVTLASSALMAFFTFISIPFFWVGLNWFRNVTYHAIALVAVSLITSGLILLVAIGASTKLLIFTALLPSVLTCVIAFVSGIALKKKELFYTVMQKVLIRLSQKNPFLFVIWIMAVAASIISLLNNFFSITVTNMH